MIMMMMITIMMMMAKTILIIMVKITMKMSRMVNMKKMIEDGVVGNVVVRSLA